MKNTFIQFLKKEKLPIALEGDKQMDELVEILQAIARTDFSARTKIEGENEKINAIGVGINMLAEELDAHEKMMQEKNRFLEDTQKATLNILEDVGLERKKVEASLTKQEAILESIGDGMVVTDTEEFIIMINRSAKKMLGLEEEDIKGKMWYEVAPLVDNRDVPTQKNERPIRLAMQEGRSISSSMYYFRRHGGEKFPASITAAPFVHDGKNIGAVVIFRDYTKEKKIDQVKSEFLLLAAHQFRTPLSIVNWYSETLISESLGPLTEDQKKYLNEIKDSSRRMTELFSALLQVSQIESGEITQQASEALDIKTLIESALEGLVHKIEENNIKIIKKYEEGVPPIVANKELMESVFKNVIKNAIIYSSKGGPVKISFSYERGDGGLRDGEKKGSILFVVEDKGAGIPQKEQSKIFTKLFRGSNVKEEDTYGNGLGLYIARGIVLHYGGIISFESKESEGSSFFIKLPLVNKKPQKMEGEEAKTSKAGSPLGAGVPTPDKPDQTKSDLGKQGIISPDGKINIPRENTSKGRGVLKNKSA